MPEETAKPSSLLPFAALIVAALLVGAIYYYVTRDTGGGTPAPEPATTSSGSTEETRQDGPPEAIERSGIHAVAGKIAVRVRDKSGAPVSGATVTGRVGATIAEAFEEVLGEQKTDAEGRCSVDLATDHPWLGVTKDGLVPVLVDLAPGGKRLDADREVEVRVIPGVPLRVRVIDASSEAPLDDSFINLYASIRGGPSSSIYYDAVHTGPDGEHLFTLVPPQENLFIAVEHPTHDYFTTSVSVPPGDEFLQVARLTRRMTLAGRVINSATGQGVAGAQVEVSPDAPPAAVRALQVGAHRIRSVTTDARGEFTIEEMSHGKLFFMVEAAGFAPTPHAAEISPEQEQPFVEIRLNTSSVIAGTVVGENSQPLTGALVYMTPAAPVIGNMSKERKKADGQVTGPDGRFRFEGVPPRAPYIVRAEHEQYVEATSEVVRVMPGVSREDLVINMAHGGTLSGLAIDSSGQPLGDVRVQAGLPNQIAGEPLPPVKTAADGTFTISRVPQGSYNITFSRDGYCEASLTRVPHNATGIKAVLVRQAIVSGEVYSETTQAAVSEFKVRVRESGRPITAAESKVRDAEGHFALAQVRPGIWDFEFRAKGLAKTILSQVSVVEGQDVDLGRIVMREGAAVEGYVLDTAQQPIFRALIELDPLDLFDQKDRDHYQLRTTSDKNGYFKIPNLTAGEYQLYGIHSKYALEQPMAVLVAEDATTRQDITMREGAKVIVEILDSYGMPVEGASVMLRNKDAPPPVSSPGHRVDLRREPTRSLADQGSGLQGRNTSDKNGRTHFLRQAAGNYMLMVGARGYRRAMREFPLDWGEEHTEKIVLENTKKDGP